MNPRKVTCGTGVYTRWEGTGVIVTLSRYVTITPGRSDRFRGRCLDCLRERYRSPIWSCIATRRWITSPKFGLLSCSKLPDKTEWVQGDSRWPCKAGGLVGPETALGISHIHIEVYFRLWEGQPNRWTAEVLRLSRRLRLVVWFRGHINKIYYRHMTEKLGLSEVRNDHTFSLWL